MIRQVAGNVLWTGANAAAYASYRRARRDARAAQARILFEFLRRNRETEYGRLHGYGSIRSIAQFQEQVPICGYDHLEPWIEKIRNGIPNVLAAEPVRLLQKTSGSSGAAKFIPYTASFLREFQNAIGAWMFDLYSRRPALLGGSQYWASSPSACSREETRGGVRVGFADDTEYLGLFQRAVVRWTMVPVVPYAAGDLARSLDTIVECLARARNLRFISVWSPTLLTLIVSRLPAGTEPRGLWPALRVISCWTSGPSARCLPELQALFPDVEIQGKGLLATEAAVSFPEVGRRAASPAITSHFLEFMDDHGSARLVDELEVGARYSVVVTTGSGLARYALGDQIEVVAPGSIEFVGRSGNVSDLCGEKLTEVFVGTVLEETAARFGLQGFLMMAPEWGSPPRYLLFIEHGGASHAAAYVDERLRSAINYDYCRRVGQLGPILALRVAGAQEAYVRGCEALGQRIGDVKSAYLRREFGWRERLAGCQKMQPELRI